MSDLTPTVGGGAIIIAAPALPVIPAAKSAFMPTGQQVLPPMGYIGFCMETRTECEGGTDEPLPFALTPQRRAELERVNAEVNALPEINDKNLYHREEYWTYASGKGGDCEDFALEKRRRLMALGWPKDALLLATGKDLQNEGHAVLVAATASGDFVLDNREPHVRLGPIFFIAG
ncbi:MAG: transglutaminase-like cysteine peptidase [Parvibaculaceae bacterium]